MKIIIALVLSISSTCFANENFWIYSGVDFGVGTQKNNVQNEKDSTDGRYFGARILGQYRLSDVDLEFGGGWADYKISTDFRTGQFSKAKLHTKAPYLQVGAYYKFGKNLSLGLFSNYVLDSGMLISDREKSSLFGGVGAYYNIKSSERVNVRIGAFAKKSLDSFDRDVHLFGLSLQLGFNPKRNTISKPEVRPPQPELTIITLDGTLINFETDSYELDNKSKAIVAEFGAFLVSNQDLWEGLVIEGHTDIRGSSDYNQHLSVKRAHAVYSELLNLSLDKRKLKFRGLGYEKPLDDNISKEAFARNRRVVLSFANVSNKQKLIKFIEDLKQKYAK